MSNELQDSYDRVAPDYAGHFSDELAGKQFDRKMLDLLIDKVGERGTICDLGCGPGQVARYVTDRGAPAFGIDLSPRMVDEARQKNPDIEFAQGNMLSLANVSDERFGGVAAFYSIIHVPRGELKTALSEIKRVLVPRGSVLLTFHIGTETIHRDEWWGKNVSIDFNFLPVGEMKDLLAAAGFKLAEVIERDPYPEEFQSRRAYIFAQKPDV